MDTNPLVPTNMQGAAVPHRLAMGLPPSVPVSLGSAVVGTVQEPSLSSALSKGRPTRGGLSLAGLTALNTERRAVSLSELAAHAADDAWQQHASLSVRRRARGSLGAPETRGITSGAASSTRSNHWRRPRACNGAAVQRGRVNRRGLSPRLTRVSISSARHDRLDWGGLFHSLALAPRGAAREEALARGATALGRRTHIAHGHDPRWHSSPMARTSDGARHGTTAAAVPADALADWSMHALLLLSAFFVTSGSARRVCAPRRDRGDLAEMVYSWMSARSAEYEHA